MGQIILVRHGQASFGSQDYDRLSDLGVLQSQRVGEWLARRGEPFDKVVVGSMVRHRQTAQACLAAMPQQLPASEWEEHPDLAEYDHHEVLARRHPHLADGPSLQSFLANSSDPRRTFQHVFAQALDRWMGGAFDHEYQEPWSAFRQRCLNVLEQLARYAQDGSVLAFTSGGPISVMCQHILGAPDHKTLELSYVLANASLTRLLVQAERMVLGTYNSFAHLESSATTNLITFR